jgi:hypothetical protein
MIQLVGPGGVGKTTIGSALAQRLALRFVDLDAEFGARYGNISVYLDAHRYEVYAERNVGLYSDLVGGPNRPDIVALSSGFMTYPDDIHPAYRAWHQRIASSPLTLCCFRRWMSRCASQKPSVGNWDVHLHARRSARSRSFAPAFPCTWRCQLARSKRCSQRTRSSTELVMALAAQQAAAPDGTGARSRAHLARGVS